MLNKETLEYLAALDEPTRVKIFALLENLPLTREELERVRFENFSTTIAAAGSTYDLNGSAIGYQTDIRNKQLIGIMIYLSKTTEEPNSTIELYCDGLEIFKSGTPISVLWGSLNVDSDKRFFPVFRRISESYIKGKYTDGNVGGAPYTVKMILMCLCETPY